LDRLPKSEAPELIVGFEHSSDAGVYKVNDEQALVQSVDFFTPIVDDPRTFGAIAAANALSDVYAMGGRPITALALVCFPEKLLSPEVLLEILLGGADKVREAGALIVGGHSVQDPELKYGLSVTGLVHPDNVRTNQAARPGEALILTKPLGTGLIANALKSGAVSEDDPRVQEAVASMAELNRVASEVFTRHSSRCATDITGFGLVGHALEVASGSGVGLRLRLGALPRFALAYELAEKPLGGGSRDNEQVAAPKVDRTDGLNEREARLAHDAQTSGGLLACVAAERAADVVAELHAEGITAAAVVGEVLEGRAGRIELVE
jgi:selenide,water dikinase